MQIWTIIDNKAILITYKAQPDKYSTYLPTIERMIGSFQAKKHGKLALARSKSCYDKSQYPEAI